jgi:hypothetical protein
VKSRVALCLVLLTPALAPLGCAHHMGSKSAEGAMDALVEKQDAEPGQRPAEAFASRAVNGALTELSDPAQQERIDAVVGSAADALRTQLTQGLVEDLGKAGDGPLAQSLVALSERAAGSAARGAMTALLAKCDPEDPACLDRRVAELSRSAGAAFTEGVERSIHLPSLIVAFLGGAAVGLLLAAVWLLSRSAREHRHPRDDGRDRPERRRSFDTSPSISTSG